MAHSRQGAGQAQAHRMGRGMDYGAAIIVDELTSLQLKEPSAAAAAVYDQPIGLRLLYQEPGGEEHYLTRYPAGLKGRDRKSTRLNSSHVEISYAVFCLKKKKKKDIIRQH